MSACCLRREAGWYCCLDAGHGGPHQALGRDGAKPLREWQEKPALDDTEYRLHQAERFLRALANATSPEDAPSWVEINRFLQSGSEQ